MKTITSFLLSLVFILVSGLIFSFSLKTFGNAFTPYVNNETGELVDFTIPLLIYGLLQLCLSLFILVNSFKCFHLFLSLYSKYKETKRDNDIHKTVKEAKYEELYKEMRGTNLPDKLEETVHTFYATKSANKRPDLSGKSLEDILNAFRKSR